jgi:DNA (cytosine-5)-methyltransferase 3A
LYRELKEINPDIKFLLENVIMSGYNYYFISNELDCEPVRICGSLVSGALRDRLYWTNIPPFSYDITGRIISNIPQPKDKRIMLQDVLTSGYTNKRKHTCLNTGSGSPYSRDSLIHRDKTTGMVTVIYDKPSCSYYNELRQVNKIELERLHNIPENYTDILTLRQAGDVIGDGWTIDVITHIFKGLK